MSKGNGSEKTDEESAPKRITIIGCGNIGSALVRGLVSTIYPDPKLITVCDRDEERIEKLSKELGVSATTTTAESVSNAELVVLAVKPNVVKNVLKTIEPSIRALSPKPLIISIAAGITIQEIESVLGTGYDIIRVMPNLPCLIGYGMTAVYSPLPHLALGTKKLFSCVGETLIVGDESDLDTITGLSASGPAYVFMMIEALADGGVKMGISRDEAMVLAAQTVFGAAALVLATGEHPAVLKDRVASPGGTTIAGLDLLEKGAFRGLLIAAVEASTTRARELGSKVGN